jgi:hypothetical protein
VWALRHRYWLVKLRALWLASVLAGCTSPPVDELPRRPPPSAAPALHLKQRTQPLPLPRPTDCSQAFQRARAEEVLAGAPALERWRTAILARVKAEPLLFVRVPPKTGTEDAWVRSYQRVLERARHPWGTLEALLPKMVHDRPRTRQVLLRDGYLFADEPELASALVDQVRLDHLFAGERVWVARGDRVLHAERAPDRRYVWSDGPERGRPARLLLFDRVGTAHRPIPSPLHRDLRELRDRVHFDQIRVARITERSVEADLRYGSLWVRTLLASDGARLDLACEAAGDAEAPVLLAHRERGERMRRVLGALRRSIQEQIDEALPFDEPKTELGQQDGRLRPRFRSAFLAGETSYEFNADEYRVLDEHGRPLSPQVCFDFLMDTLERASGTRWDASGGERRRRIGRLDFERFGGELLRSAHHFFDFVDAHPDWFDVYSVPEREQIALGHERALIDYLTAATDRFIAGDILVVFGWTPWDPDERHYHSFFVYETDPVTGFPLLIAGNAGRPTLRAWRTEQLRTPRRYLVRRIRPRLEWLESIVDPLDTGDPEPAVIIGGS